MKDAVSGSSNRDNTGLVRLGGLAMLVGFLIHATANWALKVFPPENPTLT